MLVVTLRSLAPMTQTLRDRDQVPIQYRWATEHIFADEAKWEAAVAALDVELSRLQPMRQRLCDHAGDPTGPQALLDCLQQMEVIHRALSAVTAYARLCYHVDTLDQAAAGRADQARSIASGAAAAMSFLNPQLLAIGFDTLERWIVLEPKLAPWARMFDKLKQKQQHVRSAEVEAVLSLAGDAFSTAAATHAVLTNTDLRFEPVTTARESSDAQSFEVGHGTLASLLGHPDRDVRRDAWQSYHDGHLAVKNTVANAVAAGVKQLVFTARVRQYPSTLAGSMQANELPMAVFTNLIDTFRANLPLWHRYWRLRRQALGYDQLHPWDVKAPLTDQPVTVSYEQAVQMICDGMRPMGESYVQVMRRGCLEDRWVDVYPNRGKRMGAFCSSGALPHPFVFMSYNDSLGSLSTLAHELGHAMHGHYTHQQQKVWANTSYGMFVAETASNFNQAMVRQHLYDTHCDRAFRVALIEEAFGNFHRYLFIMPTLARFEQAIHSRVECGQPLTADVMNDLMADLFQEGFGSDLQMDRPRVGITWATFPTHIYSNFYTFKYATGIAAAHALAAKVVEEGPPAAERYIDMLKSGGSLPPLETLRRAGVDMASPQPVQAAFDIMAQWLDRLESLLG
jgi:oligoendopeptidase F